MAKDKETKAPKAKGKAAAKAEAKTKKAVVKAVKGKYTFFSPIPALTQCGHSHSHSDTTHSNLLCAEYHVTVSDRDSHTDSDVKCVTLSLESGLSVGPIFVGFDPRKRALMLSTALPCISSVPNSLISCL